MNLRTSFEFSTESFTKDTDFLIRQAWIALRELADKLAAAGVLGFKVEATAAASAAPIDQPNEGGA